MGYNISWEESSVDTIGTKVLTDRTIRRMMKNDDIHYFKASNLSNLCPTPKINEQYRIITEKQFNAYALILHLIKSSKIDEMYLAIYRINEPTVESIIKLIDNEHIRKATFIISNYFNQTKKPEKWAKRLQEYCQGSSKCRHIYTHNHSKVLIIRQGMNYYVFEGSGNMSDNARIEQYVYENNKEVYNFHKNWMEDLVNEEKR